MKNYSKTISNSIHDFFTGNFNPNSKYIIALQGCSTSGKTTLAHRIKLFFEEAHACKPFVFSTDNFYKSDPEFTLPNSYDYDNPGALDWELMFESLKSFIEGKQECNYSLYDFQKCIRKDISIQNSGFNLIIIEGIFAHSLLSEKTFNTELFDPTNTFKAINPSVARTHNKYFEFLNQNTKILPIYLDLEDESIISNRIEVDKQRTNRSEEESANYTKKHVIRSTKEWIRTTWMPESIKINRELNPEMISMVLYSITKYFGSKKDQKEILELLCDFTKVS